MAGTAGDIDHFDPQSYLSPDQQDLLLAALSSNVNNNKAAHAEQFSASDSDLTSLNMDQFNALNGLNGVRLEPSFFASPAQDGPLSTFDASAMDDNSYLDFPTGEQSFDIDGLLDRADDMVDPLAESNDGDAETDGKRKSPDEDESDSENSPKRQEGEDKTVKKPGRKPLTIEPTNKRKAQNRAAQRAFRERKEKHLKDLETKVESLEKQSEAEKHENGLLRAQVDRLQTELREYRKRLSLNSGRQSSGPAPASNYARHLAGLSNKQASNGVNGNFQFEFPRFGNLPGAHIFNNGTLANKGEPDRSKSMPEVGRSVSPKHQSSGVNANPTKSPLGQHQRSSTNSSSSRPRVFHFNSNTSPSLTDSPSASSVSQFGGAVNSSCDTSPAPSLDSPDKEPNLDTVNEKGYVCHGNSEGEITFCEMLNMACGNPRNPIPRAKSQSNVSALPAPAKTPAAAASAAKTSGFENASNLDWLASQNGGQFDPTLFGDYRESTTAIVGEGDFTGGFFNDAFSMPDFGSPFNKLQTPALQKNNPLDEIERMQDGGDDEVVPGEDTSQMLSCHKIWDKLQKNPSFKENAIDMDGLCNELRAKARCSESGVVVDLKDVDAAIKRLPPPYKAAVSQI